MKNNLFKNTLLNIINYEYKSNTLSKLIDGDISSLNLVKYVGSREFGWNNRIEDCKYLYTRTCIIHSISLNNQVVISGIKDIDENDSWFDKKINNNRLLITALDNNKYNCIGGLIHNFIIDNLGSKSIINEYKNNGKYNIVKLYDSLFNIDILDSTPDLKLSIKELMDLYSDIILGMNNSNIMKYLKSKESSYLKMINDNFINK
jgi:hypothetical protein